VTGEPVLATECILAALTRWLPSVVDWEYGFMVAFRNCKDICVASLRHYQSQGWCHPPAEYRLDAILHLLSGQMVFARRQSMGNR